MRDVLKGKQPTFYEFLIDFPFALIFLIFFTLFDIVMHDSYVLPSISYCYPAQPDGICDEIRDRIGEVVGHAIEPTNQIAIGEAYFSMLQGILLFAFFSLMILRIVLGKLAGAKTTTMLFFIGFLWGLSVVILIFFGWEDTMYFVLKGQDIPDTLPWLNEVGFFKFIKPYGSDPLNVDSQDLKALNLIGLGILIWMWIQAMIHHEKKHLHRIGIRHKE